MDVGSEVLRETFDKLRPPGDLEMFLGSPSVSFKLKSLRDKRILNREQWGNLYPKISSQVSSKNFDITLLMVLLRNISGLNPPSTGWHKPPPSADLSREADIARVKYYRNEVFSHATRTSVDDATFQRHWEDIGKTLTRLGGPAYGTVIEGLKWDFLNVEQEKHYNELLKKWELDKDSITNKLDNLEVRVVKLEESVYRKGGSSGIPTAGKAIKHVLNMLFTSPPPPPFSYLSFPIILSLS